MLAFWTMQILLNLSAFVLLWLFFRRCRDLTEELTRLRSQFRTLELKVESLEKSAQKSHELAHTEEPKSSKPAPTLSSPPLPQVAILPTQVAPQRPKTVENERLREIPARHAPQNSARSFAPYEEAERMLRQGQRLSEVSRRTGLSLSELRLIQKMSAQAN